MLPSTGPYGGWRSSSAWRSVMLMPAAMGAGMRTRHTPWNSCSKSKTYTPGEGSEMLRGVIVPTISMRGIACAVISVGPVVPAAAQQQQ